MADFDKELEEYAEDKRIACKYGAKCYQKNPQHQVKYKHPPEKDNNAAQKRNTNKKAKIEVKISNDVSSSNDSDSDSNHSAKRVKLNTEEKLDSTDDTQITPNLNVPTKKQDSNDDSDKTNIDEANTMSENDEPQVTSEAPSTEPETDVKTTLMSFNVKQFIKEKFLVKMPEDFYQFWTFCENLNKNNPSKALKDIGLELVGPFDVLAGKFYNIKEKPDADYLIHWRYYYDIPEFQTVLKGDDKSGYHIGYFRDDPGELPIFLAGNYGLKDGIFSPMGSNIFAAVNLCLDNLKKSGDPFKKMYISKFQRLIQKEAEKLKLSLLPKTPEMMQRDKKVVTRTFNKIGLVVPFNRKTQLGYRELAMSNKDLLTHLNKLQNASPEQKDKILSDLQPVFTYASIAIDECDFGTGIELGWNIICHGIPSLNSTALRFLVASYSFLNREALGKIAEAHLKNRKKSCNLSIL